MLAKRRNEIAEYLRLRNSASLEELCDRFKVSINTIRRDIDDLEEKGCLRKVYGGVIFAENSQVIPLSIREQELSEEKERIGKTAAELVNEEDIIIIDAGSTTKSMVKHLKDKKVTIITNSINVLNQALPYESIEVILTGGTLLRETNSLVGKEVIDTITKFNANTAFIAATGVSLDRGITNSSIVEADIKTSILKSAHKHVLLVDHTKFNKVSLVSFAKLHQINTIITDEDVNYEYMEYFEKNNIKLIVCKL
jgi:DeoR family transcriptional regulator, myo-inositol catabolism operon repressor